MSAHPPPIPPDQRPQQGVSHANDGSHAQVLDSHGKGSADGNLAEQGRAGNIKQNTTNTGLQQDR